MHTKHYISLAVAAGLIAFLYWGVNTIPPPKAAMANETRGAGSDKPHNHDGEAGPMMPGLIAAPAATDSIVLAARKALPAHAVTELKQSEDKIAALKDSAAMIPLLEAQSKLWQEHKQLPVAAILLSKAAHLAHSEKKLNFAGQFFLELLHNGPTPSVQVWEAQQAIGCFEAALAINPNNDTLKLAIASGYIDGTGEIMKGVGVLRELTAKDPNHIPANLMLGKMSIQSGQFDKAVTRFENVLKLEPRNKEALYFLAEAYKGKGDKKKAIELFEQCKQIVNDPSFSKDIDEYIKTFQ